MSARDTPSQAQDASLSGHLLWAGSALLGIFYLLVGAFRDQRAVVHAFDSGIYLQWLTGFFRDGSLASSLTGETNFLAHHFQPLMLLLSPIVSAAPRPLTLFVCSLLALAVTGVVMHRAGRRHSALAAAFAFLLLLTQPAVGARVWYGFVPEILALPSLTWMALRIADRSPDQPLMPLWIINLLVAGLLKETLWLTNAFVCLAMALTAATYRRQWLTAMTLMIAIFVALYTAWMPAHSQMPVYYGMTYFLGPDSANLTIGETLIALLQNASSLQSLKTMTLLIVMVGVFPLAAWSPVLLGAVPGLLLIICARNDLVHHPANHYLLPVLPFLAAAALANYPRLAALATKFGLARLPAILPVIPLAVSVLATAGIMDSIVQIQAHPHTRFLRQDITEFVGSHVRPTDSLIIDGTMQPVVPWHPASTLMLGFIGNPRQLSDAELSGEHIVLTAHDLRQIPDCRSVRAGGMQLKTDYDYFVKICEWIKARAVLIRSYPDSGIHGFHIPRLSPTEP